MFHSPICGNPAQARLRSLIIRLSPELVFTVFGLLVNWIPTRPQSRIYIYPTSVQDFTPGSFLGFLLDELAIIAISLVMLRGGVFSKSAAYATILMLLLDSISARREFINFFMNSKPDFSTKPAPKGGRQATGE
jgi:hypothetical protein